MEKYIQDPPFCIQLELCEGCQLRCPFCGLNGIRTEERIYKYMTVDWAVKIAHNLKQEGWNCRFEFAMHGEPTKNPDVLEIIATFRQAFPDNYFLMETNGSGFLAPTSAKALELVRGYFDAGLSTVAIDQYQTVPWAEAFRQRVSVADLAAIGVEFMEYPRDRKGNPHARSRHKRLVIIAPIDASSAGTHSHLSNHCGAGGPLSLDRAGQRCAKPFREMAMRWDGSVAICCDDWRGAYRIGNVTTTSALELWHSPRFYAARRKLILGERTYTPCLGCTSRSNRLGLLPNKNGKGHLELPDAACERVLQQAVADGPFTPAVDRSWEGESVLVQLERTKKRSLL